MAKSKKKKMELVCKFCNKIFSSPIWMKKHLELWHGTVEYNPKKKVSCNLCGSNVRFFYLKRHIKEVHTKELRVHVCEYADCGQSFSRPNILINHIKSVHEKIKKFPCDFCPYKAAYKNSLLQHTEIWHSIGLRERNYKCHSCDKRFYDSRNLQIHVNEVHKKIRNHQCFYCNKFFSRNYLLKVHIFKVHEKRKQETKFYKCHVCDKRFTSSCTYLKKHFRKIHKDHDECDFCHKDPMNSVTESRNLPTRGVIKIENSSPSLVSSESQGHVTKSDISLILSQFVKSHHNNDNTDHNQEEVDDNKCDFCDKTFSSVTKLQKHINSYHEIITNEKECDYCGITLTKLQEHDCLHEEISTNNVINSEACSIVSESQKVTKCDTTAVNLSEVVTDLSRHDTDNLDDTKLNIKKKFSCVFCEKSFDTKGNLKKHMISVHESSSKHHDCEFCDKSFHLQGDLKQHIRIFHLEHVNEETNIHICDICDNFAYSSFEGLEKHIAAKHRKSKGV